MIEFTTYEKRSYYPHMKPGDIAIWDRFITAHPDQFSGVAYDVAVGEGASFDTTVNPKTGGNIAKLYKKKIDVVAITKDAIFIIEVKPRASLSAIGQVLAYKTLFKKEYDPAQPLIPVILTDEITPDMETLSTEMNVAIWIE